MPYIEPEKREEIDPLICLLASKLSHPGDINYIVSKLCHEAVKLTGEFNYIVLNNIMGVLECAKQEFYRTVVAPYEDKKRLENGAVSEFDDNWKERIR